MTSSWPSSWSIWYDGQGYYVLTWTMATAALLLLLSSSPLIRFDWIKTPVPESVARWCAAQVGIPYASDNFSQAQFEKFKSCVRVEMGKMNKRSA